MYTNTLIQKLWKSNTRNNNKWIDYVREFMPSSERVLCTVRQIGNTSKDFAVNSIIIVLQQRQRHVTVCVAVESLDQKLSLLKTFSHVYLRLQHHYFICLRCLPPAILWHCNIAGLIFLVVVFFNQTVTNVNPAVTHVTVAITAV